MKDVTFGTCNTPGAPSALMTQMTHVTSPVCSTLYLAHSRFSVLFKNRRGKRKKEEKKKKGKKKDKKEISFRSYLKLTEIHTWVHINFRWEPDLISSQTNRSSSFSEGPEGG